MPGLLRGVARTAVIAGTATTRVQPRQPPAGEPLGGAGRPAVRGTAAAAVRGSRRPLRPAAGQDRVEQLKELASLKEQGVLTDEEFAREKARILAG